jgi:hypothetical protein
MRHSLDPEKRQAMLYLDKQMLQKGRVLKVLYFLLLQKKQYCVVTALLLCND